MSSQVRGAIAEVSSSRRGAPLIQTRAVLPRSVTRLWHPQLRHQKFHGRARQQRTRHQEYKDHRCVTDISVDDQEDSSNRGRDHNRHTEHRIRHQTAERAGSLLKIAAHRRIDTDGQATTTAIATALATLYCSKGRPQSTARSPESVRPSPRLRSQRHCHRGLPSVIEATQSLATRPPGPPRSPELRSADGHRPVEVVTDRRFPTQERIHRILHL